MYEIVPDRPDWDEYEAEQNRIHKRYRRLTHEAELEDERMDEEYGIEEKVRRNTFKHQA